MVMNKTGNSFLMSKFTEAVWMLKPERLRIISNVLSSRFNDIDKSLNLLQLQDKKESTVKVERVGSTAILNIEGIMVPKCSWIDAMCGMTSTLELSMMFNELEDDNKVSDIVLYFDSPGGECTAIMEFAESVRNCSKHVTTFTDTEMCSAAFAVGSAADKIICMPTSTIGSIGTYIGLAKYESFTEPASESIGNKLNFVFLQAGNNKLFGNPHIAITEEEKSYFQSKVDSNYERFTKSVARYRNVSVEEVINTEGSHYEAIDAPEWMYDVLADYRELF